jgi:anti-anti-sigma factor
MTFDVVEDDDRTVTVSVSGELDITNVEALGSAVAPAIDREPSRLIVSARDLRFADSSAIALWVQWATEVPEIELRDASPLLRRVVETMGLTDTLNVTP